MELTATEWDTVADKKKFIKQFKDFVLSGFVQSKFPKWFYVKLSNTFGHIAHYNQGGFYATFFLSTASKLEFIDTCLCGGGYGSPAFTYSDVEQILKAWLIEEDILGELRKQLDQEQEADERAEYARLSAKYRGK